MRNFGLVFLLAVLGFPALEIYTLFRLADVIGWWLLAWLVLSVLIGWILIKEESLAVFGRLAVAVQNGQSPFAALWDSGRTMLAGLLLIIPGVLSDVVALILLLLPNKSDRIKARRAANDDINDDIIEGEVRVIEVGQIESKSRSE